MEHLDQRCQDDIPLSFGKHKGKTWAEIADEDPKYLIWMWENMHKPPCSEQLYQATKRYLALYGD